MSGFVKYDRVLIRRLGGDVPKWRVSQMDGRQEVRGTVLRDLDFAHRMASYWAERQGCQIVDRSGPAGKPGRPDFA